MADVNLTNKAAMAKVQSLDFVNIFTGGLAKTLELMGVTRKIAVANGMKLKTYKSTTTLVSGAVAEGDDIPLSKVVKTEADPVEIVLNKYRKAVSAEAIQSAGYDAAVVETDEKLVKEIQKAVRKDFFTQLAAGTTKVTKGKSGKGLQGALSAGWGKVQTIFEDDGVQAVAFVNPEDAAEYLGKAGITMQQSFGLTFLAGFTGVTVILNSSVPAGTVYATAPENIVCAYVPASGSELSKAFELETDQLGMIGVMHNINSKNLTYETIAVSGVKFFAENLSGIAVVTIDNTATA